MAIIKNDSIPADWKYYLENGWKIWPTSCSDGCNYAWFKPKSSGAMECHGCVCHVSLPEIEKETIECSWGPDCPVHGTKDESKFHQHSDICEHYGRHTGLCLRQEQDDEFVKCETKGLREAK